MNSEVDLTKQCYQIWQKVAKVAKKCYQMWQKVIVWERHAWGPMRGHLTRSRR